MELSAVIELSEFMINVMIKKGNLYVTTSYVTSGANFGLSVSVGVHTSS